MRRSLNSLSDEELMVLYQDGSSEAFNELFRRYEGKLYNFFLGRLRDPALSEDLYQKTFLKVHKARDRYDPAMGFKPWFFTIAYNTLRDEYRKKSSAAAALEGDGAGEDPSTPEGEAQREEAARLVRRALASLPEAQGEVIELSRLQGFSYAEIGRITGRSENAVKQMAHRAFENLRKCLAPLIKEAP